MVHKALLIGINYTGTAAQLSGCVNDVHNMRQALEGHGYTIFRVLTDEPGTAPAFQPTRANILAGLSWLTADAAPDDHLLAHYSGHGTHVPDRSRDEEDGADEAWCPLDYTSAGLITDDELAAALTGCAARVTVISDCCHSGTVLDLRVNYLQAARRQMVVTENPRAPSRPNYVVCLSGCLDTQTSADTVAPNPVTARSQPQGALTWTLLSVLRDRGTGLTYRKLLKLLWDALAANGYDQKPQLSSSHRLNLDDALCL
jgi:hypothetical protein